MVRVRIQQHLYLTPHDIHESVPSYSCAILRSLCSLFFSRGIALFFINSKFGHSYHASTFLNVVHSLRESDSVLQDVLRNDPSNDLDPDDLNALYVYETKMAFLGRLAQTRVGAERLLECRVLPILAQADFLDAQPEVDDAALMGVLYFFCSPFGNFTDIWFPRSIL